MMSLAALLLIALPGYLYLESRARKARREGRRFVEDPQFEEVTREGAPLPSWHWITGVIPPVVVFVVLNLLQWGIVVALLLAILTCCLLNFPQRRSILPAVSSGANGSLTALMARLIYSRGDLLAGKPAAAVVSCRRGGATATFQQLNQFFYLMEMPVVSSQYWNDVHGNTPEEVLRDAEGLQTMRVLGRNMAWMVKTMADSAVARPDREERVFTNFIR